MSESLERVKPSMKLDTSNINDQRYKIPFVWDVYTKMRITNALKLIKPCDSILDVGCGDGTILGLLSDKAKVVKGVDNAKSAVASGRAKGLDISLIKTAEDLPFADEEFDVVFAGEIIEHIYDVDRFLIELCRVLKKGGQLVFTTPNLASLGSRITLLLGKPPWMIENEVGGDYAGHLRYFTFASLEAIARKHGLELTMKATDTISLSPKILIKWREGMPLVNFGRHLITGFKKVR